jgi:Tol biopolymer transport system component
MDAEPSLSADGNLIAFTSDRPRSPGGSGGQGGRRTRDIYLFDRAADKFLPLPGLNSAAHEYSPSLSPDGRFIAFVSERLGGEGERDIYLYDRQTQKLLPTPGLNSKAEDFDPCVCVTAIPVE